jgi:hypothetical protein
MTMKTEPLQSITLRHSFVRWTATATPDQIRLVDAIYAACESRYEDGGDTIVEAFDPARILAEFTSVEQAIEFCGMRLEQSENAAWSPVDDSIQAAVNETAEAIRQLLQQLDELHGKSAALLALEQVTR